MTRSNKVTPVSIILTALLVTQRDGLMGSMTATVAKLRARLTRTPERAPGR